MLVRPAVVVRRAADGHETHPRDRDRETGFLSGWLVGGGVTVWLRRRSLHARTPPGSIKARSQVVGGCHRQNWARMAPLYRIDLSDETPVRYAAPRKSIVAQPTARNSSLSASRLCHRLCPQPGTPGGGQMALVSPVQMRKATLLETAIDRLSCYHRLPVLKTAPSF